MSGGALLLGLVLLVLNGFFVAAEISLLAARRGLIEERAEAGDRRAVIALKALRELPVTFSAAQLGITLASLGLGAVAEPAVAGMFKQLLGSTPLPDGSVVVVSIALALTIVVFLHMVVGEMAPKNLAVARAEDVALFIARPFDLYVRALRPLIVALNATANVLARAVGITVVDERELGYSSEELLLVLGQSRERGAIEDAEARMLVGVLELRDVDAEMVMTPRIDLVAVPTTASIEEVLAAASASGHTRLPVFDTDVDHVVGMVHVKDLLLATTSASLMEVMRPIVAVPGSRDLESLLRELLQSREQAVLVVDEFGGTSGLVTLEDIFEELVGDITDEYDDEPGVVALADGTWLVPGTAYRSDLHEELAVDIDDEVSDADTVSGWMVDRLGRLLRVGDTIMTPAGWRLEVRSLEGRRAGSVLLRPPASDRRR
jgi:CBS domain containing-hemolysin-like protein